MYISVKRALMKNCLIYTAATIFTALFGAVYEHFSHEVYSAFMQYAFAIPLLLGVLPLMCFAVLGKEAPDGWSMRIYNSGTAALTVGLIFEGALEIYGTTNRLVIVYPIVGFILIFLGIIIFVISRKRHKL